MFFAGCEIRKILRIYKQVRASIRDRSFPRSRKGDKQNIITLRCLNAGARESLTIYKKRCFVSFTSLILLRCRCRPDFQNKKSVLYGKKTALHIYVCVCCVCVFLIKNNYKQSLKGPGPWIKPGLISQQQAFLGEMPVLAQEWGYVKHPSFRSFMSRADG